MAILDGIPALRLRENANHSIKTIGSERDVPLHPQLLELGLMGYAEQLRADGGTDLSSDMKPGAGTKDKWGGKIDYHFRQVLDNRLTEGRGKKSFKSFRHYVITQLGRSKSVAENVRKDIVGHVGGSMTAERYTDTATLSEKLDALRALPRLPFAHCPDWVWKINVGTTVSRLPGAFEALKSLIEPSTARAWSCPALQLPFDMRAVNWVMTTNSIERIPQAFLNRCKLVELPEPSINHLTSKGHTLLHAAMPREDANAWAKVLDMTSGLGHSQTMSTAIERIKTAP